MRPFRYLLPLSLLVLAITYLVFGSPIYAASSANLLAAQNPSFEQGLTDWTIFYSQSDPLKHSIVTDSAKSSCGKKALQLKGIITYVGYLQSGYVSMAANTKYRFVVWLQIKTEGSASLQANEYETKNPSMNKQQVLGNSNATLNGKWQKITGIFTSLPKAGKGRLDVTFQNGNGKLLVDCASITPV